MRHFEIQGGGILPATPDSVARYLADHAETLSHNTLEQRLAALARWHTDQGFVDPTKAPVVRQVLRGIRATHPAVEKRVRPLQLELLQGVDQWLNQGIIRVEQRQQAGAAQRLKRDRALLLLGFRRGFRGDELLAMLVENVDLRPGVGMTWSLSRTKTNRHQGTNFSMPALSRLCPVMAYQAWISAAGLIEGPVFRSIDRWGHVGADGLHPNSLIPLLRHLFRQADLKEPEGFSAHSLRRECLFSIHRPQNSELQLCHVGPEPCSTSETGTRKILLYRASRFLQALELHPGMVFGHRDLLHE